MLRCYSLQRGPPVENLIAKMPQSLGRRQLIQGQNKFGDLKSAVSVQ